MFNNSLRIVAAAGVALAIFATAARAGSVVYSNDFENAPPGKEWSADKVEVTPKDNRHFLGGFTTDKLTLKLDKLPKHKYVRISLELFIIATWDGNATVSSHGARIGPDVWRMGIEGSHVLLVDASFSNMDFESRSVSEEAMTQSYPSVLSGEVFPAKTGAAERGTLGFEWASSDSVLRPVDSVYKLSFLIPHDAAEIQFSFQGAEGLQPADEECWGLDNVKVEALDDADVMRLDDAAMRKLWETIGGHDLVAETDAFWRLAAGGDDVARFLRDKVKRAGVDRKQFGKYLLALDGDDFQSREKATQGLKEMGPSIETLLREAIDKADSAEVKLRLEAALKEMDKVPPADPEMRRRAIGMKLLRAIGTPEAANVAGELSGK
ncbi:MAG: cell surface protein [Phycisphaerales bacterium]|nr:cell surface protein [Phycisphaerales bacterium]